MSLRIDSTEWISGALIIGETGGGVLGSAIPSTGDSGPGYAYNDLSLPADNAREICGRVTTWPTLGTLTAYEDTSFEFTGPDGVHSFQYQLYVDYVAVGSPVTVTLTAGTVSAAATGLLAAMVMVAPLGTATGTTTISSVGAGDLSSIGLIAPTGSAFGTVAGDAVGVGTFALVTLTAPEGAASGTSSGPSILSDADIARIAAAVLAALQSTTIPVNVTHFNGNLTQGSGRLGDPVRPA